MELLPVMGSPLQLSPRRPLPPPPEAEGSAAPTSELLLSLMSQPALLGRGRCSYLRFCAQKTPREAINP